MQLAGTDLRVLRVFDAVVRHGGVAAAQAELNVSQPISAARQVSES